MRELSKGMVTQLHLALILAIDARLLVLDEPTLGLDLLYRRQFYDTLLNDYFDKERTILLTTHQVEEVENLLTDVIFIQPRAGGTRSSSVEDLGSHYLQLNVSAEQAARARALKPFYERELFGRVATVLRGPPGRGAGPARRAAHAFDRRPVRRQDAGSEQSMKTETAPLEAGTPPQRRAGRNAPDAAHADSARILGAPGAVAGAADRHGRPGGRHDLRQDPRRARERRRDRSLRCTRAHLHAQHEPDAVGGGRCTPPPPSWGRSSRSTACTRSARTAASSSGSHCRCPMA